MFKNKYLTFALFILLCIGFCNLLDLLYSAYITRSAYHFTLGDDLFIPLLVAVSVGVVLFLRKPAKKES